jgi:hypothetical protein
MFIISRCNGLSVEYCSDPICDILFSEPVNELAVKENEKLQVGDLLLQNNGTLTVTFGSSVSVHSSAIFGEDTTIILNVSLNNVSTTEPIINISGCVTTPKKWKLHLNLSSNSDTFSSGSLNPINVLSASSFCNNSGSEPDLILDGSISENCVFTTSSASASTKVKTSQLSFAQKFLRRFATPVRVFFCKKKSSFDFFLLFFFKNSILGLLFKLYFYLLVGHFGK